MKKYYSLREISAELGIPKSTVVKYKDFFTDFLKMSGDGKRKKFDESALEILKKIRDLRETQRLDWLEIKDILNQEYGAAEDETGGDEDQNEASLPVPVAPAAVAASSPKVDYIAHMITVLGSQMMEMSESMESADNRATRNNKGLIALAKRLVKVERKLDLVITEMLNRDGKQIEDMKKTAGDMRKEFDRVYVAIQHLTEEVAKAGKAPAAEAAVIDQMKQMVDKLGKDGAMFQSKYQLLLRENEVLKAKIRDLSYKQHDKTEELTRRSGGLRSIFKRN